MTIRILFSLFFLIYGASLPFLSPVFFEQNYISSLSIIAISLLLSALLLSGKALLMNIILSFYILRVYLTRPFVDVFAENLQPWQFIFIGDKFWNTSDAQVVYLSLLSLLIAWYMGLHFFENKVIKCLYKSKDRYAIYLGICYLENLDLNKWMVKNGDALAYKKYSRKYELQEQYAKENKIGIWQGTFLKPEEWRRIMN